MSQVSPLPGYRELFSTNPPLWAIWLVACRVSRSLKSRCLARIFRAPGLYLGPGCVVLGSRHIAFGKRVYAEGHLWLEAVTRYGNQLYAPSLEIGDDVVFSDGVHVSCVQRVTIQRNSLIGRNVYISDGTHGSYKGANQSSPHEPPALRELSSAGPVNIGEGVCIGDHVVILGPVTIGDGVTIPEYSVVRHDVPARTVVSGTRLPIEELAAARQSR